MEEIWKNLTTHFNTYQISNMGVIKIKKTGRILKQHLDKQGCSCVTIYTNNIPKKLRVKNLVAKHFLHNPYHYKYIRNINLDKRDNRAENLEWLKKNPYKKRSLNKFTCSKLDNEKVKEIKYLLTQSRPRKEIAKTYQVSLSAIQKIASGESWNHIRDY